MGREPLDQGSGVRTRPTRPTLADFGRVGPSSTTFRRCPPMWGLAPCFGRIRPSLSARCRPNLARFQPNLAWIRLGPERGPPDTRVCRIGRTLRDVRPNWARLRPNLVRCRPNSGERTDFGPLTVKLSSDPTELKRFRVRPGQVGPDFDAKVMLNRGPTCQRGIGGRRAGPPSTTLLTTPFLSV